MEQKWLKKNDPKLFQNAVFTDKAIRKVPQLNRQATGLEYLHKDRKDLDTVDLSQTDDYDDFMTSGCEWYYGLGCSTGVLPSYQISCKLSTP